MGDRNRFSRWRRLPPVFRSGEHRLPGYEDESHRLSLYLPGSLLDLAQKLADIEGVDSVQTYCARLLAAGLESEAVRRQVAQIEAKRGPLRGFDAIAHDAEYLSEWQDRSLAASSSPQASADVDVTVPLFHVPEIGPETLDGPDPAAIEAPITVKLTVDPRPEPTVAPNLVPEILDGRAMDIVWNHVGPESGDGAGFLPRLRRGEPVPPAVAAELLEALRILEAEHRGADGLERRMAYALYRLALEAQVLMTEVWPGAFDEPTVAAVRAVQEMVERILAGGPDQRAETIEHSPGGSS